MDYIMKKFDLGFELEPISRAHGKIYKGQASYGDIDIAVLYHPCVAVYNPNNLGNLKKDFEILKKYAA